MTDRLSSGSDRLDIVLGGGLPRNGIVLIGGNPGSGKTILAQQYVFHNASIDRPAMYLTTVSEPLEKILRYGQSLDFFDPAALGTSVIYEDLGRTLNDEGLTGALPHFIFAGANRGENGVIATFLENPTQLERILKGFSWSLDDPAVELMYRTPVDLYLDEWVYDLLDTVQRTGATRIAIDSLGDLRASAGDEIRFREYIYSLLQRCARANISVVMTQEVPDLFGVSRLSEYGISHLSDNVILLQFLRGDSRLKRALTILKARGSTHDPSTRQYEITTDGVILGDQFDHNQDLT